jgi:hypothetical protein
MRVAPSARCFLENELVRSAFQPNPPDAKARAERLGFRLWDDPERGDRRSCLVLCTRYAVSFHRNAPRWCTREAPYPKTPTRGGAKKASPLEGKAQTEQSNPLARNAYATTPARQTRYATPQYPTQNPRTDVCKRVAPTRRSFAPILVRNLWMNQRDYRRFRDHNLVREE